MNGKFQKMFCEPNESVSGIKDTTVGDTRRQPDTRAGLWRYKSEYPETDRVNRSGVHCEDGVSFRDSYGSVPEDAVSLGSRFLTFRRIAWCSSETLTSTY